MPTRGGSRTVKLPMIQMIHGARPEGIKANGTKRKRRFTTSPKPRNNVWRAFEDGAKRLLTDVQGGRKISPFCTKDF